MWLVFTRSVCNGAVTKAKSSGMAVTDDTIGVFSNFENATAEWDGKSQNNQTTSNLNNLTTKQPMPTTWLQPDPIQQP